MQTTITAVKTIKFIEAQHNCFIYAMLNDPKQLKWSYFFPRDVEIDPEDIIDFNKEFKGKPCRLFLSKTGSTWTWERLEVIQNHLT